MPVYFVLSVHKCMSKRSRCYTLLTFCRSKQFKGEWALKEIKSSWYTPSPSSFIVKLTDKLRDSMNKNRFVQRELKPVLHHYKLTCHASLCVVTWLKSHSVAAARVASEWLFVDARMSKVCAIMLIYICHCLLIAAGAKLPTLEHGWKRHNSRNRPEICRWSFTFLLEEKDMMK